MVCGPALFQVWYYPELDILGAAATLWVGSCLLQSSKLSLWRWVGITLAIGFSMLLKEASALVQLAFLGGVAIALWETNPRLRNRHLFVTAVSASAWGLLVLPLLAGPDTTVGALPIFERISVVEHNFAQAVYLLSPSGVLLLLFGALAKAPFNKRVWRTILNLPTLGIAGLIAMPLISFYSHYEAIYYSPRWFGLMFGGLFALGLAVSAVTRRREESARIATYTVAAGFVGMSIVGLIAPTAREDLAARIFIGFAPIMFALALTGLDLTKAVVTLRKNTLASLGRYSCTALLVTMIWHPIASGINYTTDYRARHMVDLQGKETFSQIDVGEGLVLFNHYVEWLDPLGIMAAGGDISVRDWEFLQVPAWLMEGDYPKARWIYPDFLDFEKYSADRDVWLYWLSAKSLMTERANEALIGQLSWTRKDFGLFTPVVGDGHNRPEDHRFSIYRTEESPLERSFSDADPEWAASQRFITVPIIATDIFRRAIIRVPLIEQYEYRGAIFKR
jgi:hypothetical protein